MSAALVPLAAGVCLFACVHTVCSSACVLVCRCPAGAVHPNACGDAAFFCPRNSSVPRQPDPGQNANRGLRHATPHNANAVCQGLVLSCWLGQSVRCWVNFLLICIFIRSFAQCCGSRFAAAGQSACSLCTAGRFSSFPLSTNCSFCSNGNFAPASGLSACSQWSACLDYVVLIACLGYSSVGEYSLLRGSTACAKCCRTRLVFDSLVFHARCDSQGTFQDSFAASSCVIGRFSAAGAALCNRCGDGTYETGNRTHAQAVQQVGLSAVRSCFVVIAFDRFVCSRWLDCV